MRKLVALALAFFFLWQSSAALSVPVEPCCMEPCKASVCALAACQACASPAAVNGIRPIDPLLRQVLMPPVDDAAPQSAVQRVWRPPD
jgi:hypothetical protein